MDAREKVTQRPTLGHFPDVNLPPTTLEFFSDFGPDLCRMRNAIYERLPQTSSIEPRELETAGILQGLRTPALPSLDLDLNANGIAQHQHPQQQQQQQLLNNQILASEANMEPTLLQPQEWFQPYGGIGNWLMVDWDQGFGW